jgi:acid phosphatase
VASIQKKRGEMILYSNLPLGRVFFLFGLTHIDISFFCIHRDAIVDNMLPNPFCHRLNHLSREFTKTVSDMLQDKFASLSKRLEKYVPSVSLESHPSSNGLMGKINIVMIHYI